MSGLLFLASIAGFVLIAYWAFRNDGMGLSDQGSGLLAMRTAAKPTPLPNWKKQYGPVIESPRRLNRLKNSRQEETALEPRPAPRT